MEQKPLEPPEIIERVESIYREALSVETKLIDLSNTTRVLTAHGKQIEEALELLGKVNDSLFRVFRQMQGD